MCKKHIFLNYSRCFFNATRYSHASLNKGTEASARNNFSPLNAVKRHKKFFLHMRKLLEGKKMRKNIRCARRAYATRHRNFQKFSPILDATVESAYDRYGRPSVNCAASDTPSWNNGRGRMICVFDAPDKHKQR